MAEARGTLLVVDDEPDVRLGLRALLERAGFAVEEAPDGRAGLRALHDVRPDLVLLDIEMPLLDGWETLERVRTVSDVPVLILTAHGLEMERVRGLRGGADDYLVKPFGNQELLARVEVLLRRHRPAEPEPTRYEDARVRIDVDRREVVGDAGPVALTPLEFRLLVTFVRAPGRVLAHDELLERVWGDATDGGGDQLRSAIRHLRAKLAWGSDGPLESVRGIGYRYAADR